MDVTLTGAQRTGLYKSTSIQSFLLEEIRNDKLTAILILKVEDKKESRV